MKAAILALALFAGSAFGADLVARNGADEVRITDQPCTNEGILSMIQPDEKLLMRKGSGTFKGKRFEACWLAYEGMALLVYEDGEQGRISLDSFKKPLSL